MLSSGEVFWKIEPPAGVGPIVANTWMRRACSSRSMVGRVIPTLASETRNCCHVPLVSHEQLDLVGQVLDGREDAPGGIGLQVQVVVGPRPRAPPRRGTNPYPERRRRAC
jgi:hypothetical protein